MRSLFSNTVTVVAGARQLLRAGQARRAGTDHRDALAGLARRRQRHDPAFLPSRDRRWLHSIVLMVTGLSSMFSVQDASHGAGQMRPVNSGKLLVECRIVSACAPLVAVDQVVPVRDHVVDRTAVVAERNAAIHAARGLAVQRFGRQRLDEFLAGLTAGCRAFRSRGRGVRFPRKPVALPIDRLHRVARPRPASPRRSGHGGKEWVAGPAPAMTRSASYSAATVFAGGRLRPQIQQRAAVSRAARP